MHAKTLTFPATPAQIQKLLAGLLESGSQVRQQPDGSYEIKGQAILGEIDATASYAEPTLTVVVLKHGWNPMDEIEKGIRKHLG